MARPRDGGNADNEDYVTRRWLSRDDRPRARSSSPAPPPAANRRWRCGIAERDGGCVINADASQVYACWRVLTARPGDADLARAPHRLYGHVACGARYSVGAWLRDVAPRARRGAARRGLRPIIVGGTGLYLDGADRRSRRHSGDPAGGPRALRGAAARRRIDALLDGPGRATIPATFARIDRDNPHARAARLGGADGDRPRPVRTGTGRPRRRRSCRPSDASASSLTPDICISLTMR